MTKRKPGTVRREVAVLFLVAMALAVPGVLLARGRNLLPSEPAAPTQKDTEKPFMPLVGGPWDVAMDAPEAQRLMGLFFDTLAALSEGEELPEPEGGGVDAPVFVTVFGTGGQRTREKARAGSLSASVQEAAEAFFGKTGGQLDPSLLRVRIDVVRSACFLPLEQRTALAERGFGEPLGFALHSGEGLHFFLAPDVVDYRGQGPADVMSSLSRRSGLGPQGWLREDVPMWALRTVGFINDSGGSRRVLASDDGLIAVSHVTSATLLRAVRLAGDYLVQARSDDDSFMTFWDALSDLRGGCQSLTRQAAAAAALSELGRVRRSEKYLGAAYETISFLMRHTDVDARNPAMAFTTREEVCQQLLELEASARVLEALCRFHAGSGLQEPVPWIEAMAEFLLFMQREDGRFDLKYDPQTGRKTTPVALAEALAPQATAALALALAHRELNRPDLLEAAERALDAVARSAESEDREWSPEEARAVVEAILEVQRVAPDEARVVLAQRVADRRRRAQLCAADAPAPEMAGATVAGWPPRAGPTAEDLEVFAALCVLDPSARQKYLPAAEQAARYLMGLQFLPENSYYLPDPSAARGGFRERVGSNLVRLQTVEAALRGLILLTEVKLSEDERDS